MTSAPSLPYSLPGSLQIDLEKIDDQSVAASRWLALENRAKPSFFTSWAWQGTWLELTADTPYLFSAKLDERDIVLAILTKGQAQRRFVNSPSIFLNHSSEPEEHRTFIEYNSLLVDQEYEHDYFGLLLAGLNELADKNQWLEDVLEFQFSGTTLPVSDFPMLDMFIAWQNTRKCPWVDLSRLRKCGNDYLQLLSKNTRYQLRRSIHRFDSGSFPEITRASSTEEALSWLEMLAEHQKQRWISSAGGAAMEAPFIHNFVTRLVEKEHAPGDVDVIRAQDAEKTVGFSVNFIHNGEVLNYQTGFCEPRHKTHKPGLTCHAAAIMYYAKKGYKRYNFLAGDSQYKRSLSTNSDTLYWSVMQRKNLKLGMERKLRKLLNRLPIT